MKLFTAVSSLVENVGKFVTKKRLRKLHKSRQEYVGKPREDLRRWCHEATLGQFRQAHSGKRPRFKSRLLVGRDDNLLCDLVALGVEAFAHAPADLPPGARLYPEQVEAAVSLTQRCVIQMDTGEGKTYAILPAGFALACVHHRVYIICANEYLAWRDASRTRPFWDEVGLSAGLCITGTSQENWGCRVIYTTLTALSFRELQNDGSANAVQNPIGRSAVIVDEADAILLDQRLEVFSLVRPVSQGAFDWQRSIELAKALEEPDEIVVDRAEFTARLTVEGEKQIKKALGLEQLHGTEPLSLRHTVEVAFVACELAKEDVDYVVEGGKVFPVDRKTSRIERGKTPEWILPLEYMRGFGTRPFSVTLDSLYPSVFLQEFAHLSGLSGTIKADALEYLLDYMLPCTIVLPRVPRRDGRLRDKVFRTNGEAFAAIKAQTLDALQDGRPVLIGTQTTEAAESVYEFLKPAVDPVGTLTLLSGRNEHDIANVFADAGRPGEVIVCTQIAGRGVDIRLVDEARENGGFHLISVGHALDARLDRQFLGRVGRQGDPYSANFICSFEDVLFRRFLGDVVRQFLDKVGLDEGEGLESRIIDNAIARIQHQMRVVEYRNRRHAGYVNEMFSEIRPRIRTWFRRRQFRSDAGEESPSCPEDFLDWVVQRYTQSSVTPIVGRLREVRSDRAEELRRVLESELDLSGDQLGSLAAEINGLAGGGALEIVRQRLLTELVKVQELAVSRLTSAKTSFDRFGELWASVGREMRSLEARWRPLDEQFTEVVAVGDPEFEADSTDELASSEVTLVATETLLEKWLSRLDASSAGMALDLDRSLYRGVGELLSDVPETITEEESDSIERMLLNLEEISRESHEMRPRHKQISREPRHIAHWTITHAWSGFLEERDRVIYRSFQHGLRGLERYRFVNDQVEDLWSEREADLAKDVVKNLFKADRAETLDELFRLEEHTVATDDPRRDGLGLEWDQGPPSVDFPVDREQRTSTEERLIAEFIAGADLSEAKAGLTAQTLEFSLIEFFRGSPLSGLQTTARIQEGLERFNIRQIEHGIVSARRKQNNVWLLKFLRHLSDRNLIAPLPQVHHRVLRVFDRLAMSMTELRTMLPVIGVGALVALYAGFAFVTVGDAGDLSRGWDYLDVAVFGGLLADRSVAAPMFGSLLVAMAAVKVFQPNRSEVWGVGWERLLALFVQVGIAWWLMSWSVSQGTSVMWASIVSLGIVGLAQTTQVIAWNLQNESGLPVATGWFTYTVPFVALPYVAAQANAPVAVLLYFVVLVVLNFFWSRYNNHEFVMISARQIGPAQSVEKVQTCVAVQGGCGSAPHIFAFLIAFSFDEVARLIVQTFWANESASLAIVGYLNSGVYMAVAALWIWITMKARFDLDRWQNQLNLRRQRLEGAESRADIASLLHRVRRKVMSMELAYQLALVVAAVFAAQTFWPQENPIAALFVVALAAVFAQFSLAFAQSVYNLLVTRGPTQQMSIDQYEFDDAAEPTRIWDKLRAAVNNKLAVVLSLVVLVLQGVDALKWVLKFFQGDS